MWFTIEGDRVSVGYLKRCSSRNVWYIYIIIPIYYIFWKDIRLQVMQVVHWLVWKGWSTYTEIEIPQNKQISIFSVP